MHPRIGRATESGLFVWRSRPSSWTDRTLQVRANQAAAAANFRPESRPTVHAAPEGLGLRVALRAVHDLHPASRQARVARQPQPRTNFDRPQAQVEVRGHARVRVLTQFGSPQRHRPDQPGASADAERPRYPTATQTSRVTFWNGSAVSGAQSGAVSVRDRSLSDATGVRSAADSPGTFNAGRGCATRYQRSKRRV